MQVQEKQERPAQLKSAVDAASERRLFGSVMLINFLLYFFIYDYPHDDWHVALIMRLVAAALCVPLTLKYLLNSNAYWYIVLTVCLPFFFTFMTLNSGLSPIWLMSSVSAAFFLILLVKLPIFSIILAVGVSLGMLLFKLLMPPLVSVSGVTLYDIVTTYIAVVVIGTIFSYGREAARKDREDAINAINGQLQDKVYQRTEELERALAAKSEFLNNISHEIRTPIQGVSAIAAGLDEHWDEFDEPKRHQLMGMIAFNARRLHNLVGNLLDLAKFSAGKILLDLEELDLRKVAQDLLDECVTLYLQEKQVELILSCQGPCRVAADRERIIQVLRNLMINSIKFSPANGQITLAISNDPGMVHIEVTDQGIGIPPGEELLIFQPFVQSSSTKTKAGGTGLGLAICHDIISAHHGRIWATNNPGGGVTFSVTIPTDSSSKPSEQLPSTPAANILLIDDEEACLMSMDLLLYGSNYILHKANGGVAGLEFLRTHPGQIDVILLDLMMPDIYGLNLLADLKHDQSHMHIPVILQSGTSDEAEIKKAFVMGVAGFIRKPYDKPTILAEIAKVLA